MKDPANKSALQIAITAGAMFDLTRFGNSWRCHLLSYTCLSSLDWGVKGVRSSTTSMQLGADEQPCAVQTEGRGDERERRLHWQNTRVAV